MIKLLILHSLPFLCLAQDYNFSLQSDIESTLTSEIHTIAEAGDLSISRSLESPLELIIIGDQDQIANFSLVNDSTTIQSNLSKVILNTPSINSLDISANGFSGQSGQDASYICAQGLSQGIFGQAGIDHIGQRDRCTQLDIEQLTQNSFSCEAGFYESDSNLLDIEIYSKRRHCRGVYSQITCRRTNGSTYIYNQPGDCPSGESLHRADTITLDEYLLPSEPNCNNIDPQGINREITWVNLGVNRNSNYPIETIECNLDTQNCLDVIFSRTQLTSSTIEFNPTKGERGVSSGIFHSFSYALKDREANVSHLNGQGGSGGIKDLNDVELTKYCIQLQDANDSTSYGLQPRVTYKRHIHKPFTIGSNAANGEISQSQGKSEIFFGLDSSQRQRITSELIKDRRSR